MTSTLEPLPTQDGDDPTAVLARARTRKRDEDDAARDVMRAAARWAAMHSGDSLVGPVETWHENGVAGQPAAPLDHDALCVRWYPETRPKR
jgi:hypothetical protein